MKKYFLYVNQHAFEKQSIQNIYISIDDNIKTSNKCIYIKINEMFLRYNELNTNYLKNPDVDKSKLAKALTELNIFALILEEVTKLLQINEETDTIISNLQIEKTINKTLFKYASLINNEL